VETVRFSEAELLELQQRLVQDSDWLRSTGFTMYSMSVDIMDNVAELTGATNGPRAKERIHERYGREMLRIVAHDMVAEPEQPLEGEGWRLLAELPRGGIYSVAAFRTVSRSEGSGVAWKPAQCLPSTSGRRSSSASARP